METTETENSKENILNIENILKRAKDASLKIINIDSKTKNEALKNIAKEIEENKAKIFEENKKDLEKAAEMLQSGELTKSSFDRLHLDENKLNTLIEGIYDLIKLENPINKVLWEKELDDNLVLKKITVPIGLIGVIFEARPDCFIQIASLMIKSSNAAVLKGGKEAYYTNTCFYKLLNKALKETKGFDENAINLVYERDDIKKMLEFDNYIDLIIPRGSNKLVKYIKANTKIPVLGHASGICHIFVDQNYDYKNAKEIIIDAKTQYPSACNSVETLLVHKNYSYIDKLKQSLKKAGIEIIENPADYSKEYSDKILSFKLVDSVDEAIEHINKFGSHHTDTILSENEENIEKFMNLVDSSSVFSNCSTRFSDGFRYGFGAEVGISTNKTHARGPVGLEGLTIYKYKLYGKGDIVRDYAEGKKNFKHRDII